MFLYDFIAFDGAGERVPELDCGQHGCCRSDAVGMVMSHLPGCVPDVSDGLIHGPEGLTWVAQRPVSIN